MFPFKQHKLLLDLLIHHLLKILNFVLEDITQGNARQ